MMRESIAVQTAERQRRRPPSLAAVRKQHEAKSSRASTLRQRVGNHGIQRLVSKETVTPKAQRLCPACDEDLQKKQQAESTTASSVEQAEVHSRNGDPAKIPPTLPCPTDATPGRPAGADLRFPIGGAALTGAHTAALITLRGTWLAAGGTDDIVVHGYASTIGQEEANWTLSCTRAEAVRTELIRLGIPAVRINVLTHGASTEFGSGAAANQHVVVTTRAGILPLPLTAGLLTAADSFAGRSTTRFGVGETIDLSFLSLPARPAADFGGLDWVLASGAGTLTPPLVAHDGTGTYIAPATAGPVRLELRVAGGATAGRVVSSHTIDIVAPSKVRMTDVPGTAPNFRIGGTIPAGTWGAGFLANVFFDPKDVSFRGVLFSEGAAIGVVTPPGSFLAPFAGAVHPVGANAAGGGGNSATGTQLLGNDQISQSRGVASRALGISICGTSDFVWAIPWRFSVGGSAPAAFDIANHHARSTTFCDAFIEKAGAGPFRRPI
jgi:outer membrane protein OmpA-like peptidoglycan-associated protein